MSTLSDRVETAVTKIEDSSDIAEKFADASATVEFNTPKGPVKPIGQLQQEADAAIARIAHFKEETWVAGQTYTEKKIYFIHNGIAYNPVVIPYTAGLVDIQADIDAGLFTVLQGLTDADIAEGAYRSVGRKGAALPSSRDTVVTVDSVMPVSMGGQVNNAVELDLELGQKVAAGGHYQKSDGGNGEYLVVTGEVSGFGSVIDMDNGLQLKLLPAASLNLRQFGVLDGMDATQRLIEAFRYSEVMGLPLFGHVGESYTCTELITSLSEFYGRGCSFFAPSGLIRLDRPSLFVEVTQDILAGDLILNVTPDSVAVMESGGVISIRSTDLFNNERSYYYKGINTKINILNESQLTLQDVLPFDLLKSTLLDSTSTTGVYYYSRKSVVLKDFSVTGIKQTGVDLIYIEGCSDVSIQRLNIASAEEGLSIRRCVDVDLTSVRTRDCINYGCVLRSTTGVRVRGGAYEGDIVGLDTGGNEPCYRTSLRNVSCVSANGSYGFSQHANSWDSDLTGCHIKGIKLAGRVTVRGGSISSNNDQGTDYCYFHVSQDPKAYKYSFQDVTFERGVKFRYAGNYQEIPVDRIYVDSIVFKDCIGHASLYLDLDLTSQLGEASKTRFIRVDNSDIRLMLADIFERIDYSGINTSIYRSIEQIEDDLNVARGRINSLYIHDLVIPDGNESFQIRSFDKCVLERVDLYSGTSVRFESVGAAVSLRDCDFGSNSVFRSDVLERLLIDNTKIVINEAYVTNINNYIERDKY